MCIFQNFIKGKFCLQLRNVSVKSMCVCVRVYKLHSWSNATKSYLENASLKSMLAVLVQTTYLLLGSDYADKQS